MRKPKLGDEFDEWMGKLRRIIGWSSPEKEVEEISNDPWELITQISCHMQDELELERSEGNY